MKDNDSLQQNCFQNVIQKFTPVPVYKNVSPKKKNETTMKHPETHSKLVYNFIKVHSRRYKSRCTCDRNKPHSSF